MQKISIGFLLQQFCTCTCNMIRVSGVSMLNIKLVRLFLGAGLILAERKAGETEYNAFFLSISNMSRFKNKADSGPMNRSDICHL